MLKVRGSIPAWVKEKFCCDRLAKFVDCDQALLKKFGERSGYLFKYLVDTVVINERKRRQNSQKQTLLFGIVSLLHDVNSKMAKFE